MKKVLLCDVDGVIADCATQIHAFAEELFERQFPTPDKWYDWNHEDALGLTPEEAGYFHRCALVSDFPHYIKLYPGAAELVHELKEAYDVVFLTAPWRGNSSWVVARENLLQQFDCDIVFTSAKHRVPGDILCDDKQLTIERGGPWRGLLYTRPWNLKSNMPRISCLSELLK